MHPLTRRHALQILALSAADLLAHQAARDSSQGWFLEALRRSRTVNRPAFLFTLATRTWRNTPDPHILSCAASGIGKVPGGYGLTAIVADFDDDSWPNIYVACHSTPALLFQNNHGGTFSERAMETGIALSEDGMNRRAWARASATSC